MVWDGLIIGLIIFDTLLTIWLARMLSKMVRFELEGLDSKIGAALKALIEQGIGDFEPPSPIQAALAEMLMSRVKAAGPGEPVEIIRDAGGKFSG